MSAQILVVKVSKDPLFTAVMWHLTSTNQSHGSDDGVKSKQLVYYSTVKIE